MDLEALRKQAREEAQFFLENDQEYRMGYIEAEKPHPLTRRLSGVYAESVEEGVKLLLSVDAEMACRAAQTLAGESYARFADTVRKTLAAGGRVIFSGCGSSGRLSMRLEQSWRNAIAKLSKEYPQAEAALQEKLEAVGNIMTGGDYAVIRAVESFEDSTALGEEQARELHLCEKDLLVGVTATGETTSILGTAMQALRDGASVYMLICADHRPLIDKMARARVVYNDPKCSVMFLPCGPMALTGSTRMQSSTFEQLAGAVALEGALCDLLQAQGIDMQFRGYSWYGEQFASMTAQLLSEKSVSVLADASRVSPTETVGKDDPLSFYGRMKREFYDLVRPDLVMPESQRYFPAPGQEETYDLLIEELGGVDACFGGMGINGHVAFNEPPETDAPMTADEFAVLGTRVLPISRETKTINAYGYNRGDLQGMPQWCVTVGMKQILSAKKVYIALNRSWQNGPFKHALLDEQTANVPASLLQRCKDVTYCGIAEVMDVVI